ncbi:MULTISPECIES: carbamoyltransferase HypF [unclassified Wenzhouxiangella]|uniref:carbamoyltransferase HypF n=1 Tax=unclassified Wenzhouxiangella TaxID=2613841 RepID=UPI000E326723|nr:MULTISPECIES: carbamoyltransferase HypF [unclassified Wenzhouxiangella]RFF28075.1 carbamoyltransferase HypF [Wenzhouxiangella sp. 15181]RFP68661.1 carbamoyltransferase HypF [Wenzhouxiangella sp. 15190]
MQRVPDAASPANHDRQARRLTIGGRVQAVGYRPFVYRLAHRLGITGWVYNATGEVEIAAEGSAEQLDRFARDLVEAAPPLARPKLLAARPADVEAFDAFRIRKSHGGGKPRIHVPPDQFACADCLAEMRDPAERRHRYPFINCTQCGPRYTIIRAMPYDRPNTTLADFPLCPDCHAEYTDPLDRRFHAQPLACAECGPHLSFHQGTERVAGNDPALAACVAEIEAGGIVAIRGIGGYHLVCDAANETAVGELRKRKHRPDKPLALMVPATGGDGLDAVRELARPDAQQAECLTDPTRPIVLIPLRPDAPLAPSVAPGLDEIGLMLPYAPLHELLLESLGRALVATSGNISGEPVITDVSEAESRLGAVADAFLHHNRPIERPADDPVIRQVAGRPRPIRLGRGTAPMELELPVRLEQPLLATGAFLKNTVALAWDERVVISPHVGDLGSRRSRDVFERLAADLQSLYGVEAEHIACDAHPDFPNSRWARESGLPVTPIQHHAAHAGALAGEFSLTEPIVVFAWDGVGYGEDGSLWGGEALLGAPGDWRRVASFRRFRLPGGDRVTHQPWRTALSLVWHAGIDWSDAPPYDDLLRQAWTRGFNSPPTSAVGRLFDAAAVFAGVVGDASHEGQGPMRLEAVCSPDQVEPVDLPLERDDEGLWRSDWAPLIQHLARGGSREHLASIFHESMALNLLRQAEILRREYDIETVGLTGGVFQNRRLAASAIARLENAGFKVLLPETVPVNDAGISFGQVIETAARLMTPHKG